MRQWFSFKALISSRLAYKEFENCPALGTKREIAAMWSPAFLFNAWNLSNYHSQLMPNSPKTMSKSLTFVVPSSLTSVGHVSL